MRNPFKRKANAVDEIAGLSPEVLEVVKKLIADASVNGYNMGYNDGKHDGIEISKQAAIKGLKESLWQQNQHEKKK